MKTSTFTLCIVVKNGDMFEVSKQASLYNTFSAHTGSQVEDILYIAAAYDYQTLDTIQLHTLTISLDVHASLPSTQKQWHEMHRGMCEANNRYSHGTKHALDSYLLHTEYYIIIL